MFNKCSIIIQYTKLFHQFIFILNNFISLSMLEKLCKKDAQWRKIALQMCKCKELADDIVQDMYIRLHDKNKELNDFYVVLTMRSIFIDYKRNDKKCDLDFDIQDNSYTFETDDFENKILNTLNWLEKGYLELSFDMSLREMEKELNTNYNYIYKVIKNAKAKVNG